MRTCICIGLTLSGTASISLVPVAMAGRVFVSSRGVQFKQPILGVEEPKVCLEKLVTQMPGTKKTSDIHAMQ